MLGHEERETTGVAPDVGAVSPPPNIARDAEGVGRRRHLDLMPALAAAAYFLVFADLIDGAATGPQTTYLIVVPALAVTVSLGNRSSRRTAGPDLSTPLLLGCAGSAALYLLCARLPDLAASWGLPLLYVLPWSAATTATFIGVGQAIRMWPLWAYGVGCAVPLPNVLAAHGWGHSEATILLLATLAGCIAAHGSARRPPRGLHGATAITCAVVASAGVLTVGAREGIPLTGTAAAAIVPLVALIALRRVANLTGRTPEYCRKRHFQ